MFQRRHLLLSALGLASAAMLAACGGSGDDAAATTTTATPQSSPVLANQLYTQTNEPINTVLQYTRSANGELVRAANIPTAGLGTNGIRINGTPGPNTLGSQFSVITLSADRLLLVANGGDNSITVFSLDASTGTPMLKKNTATQGLRPNSLAVRSVGTSRIVYASFLGGSLQLGAYRLNDDGSLAQLGLYNVAQMGGLNAVTVAPTQLLVSPDGRFVMLSTGTATNAVLSFPVNADGSLGNPVSNTTQFATPFAGQFVKTSSGATVYLSTGITGISLTSYTMSSTGVLTQASQAAASGVGAPCWLSVTPNGRFAYVGNGSGSISSYMIGADGTLSLLQSMAAMEPSVLAGVNSVAGDSWISPDGKYLYSTYLGADKIVSYGIDAANGSLTKLGEVVVGSSSKLGLQGLAGV